MVKKPGNPARGSSTGRPLMVLLDVLGQRWTLRVLWELRNGRVTFRALRSLCDEVSPTLLNARLKTLRDLALVDLDDEGYGLTPKGADLARQFAKLDRWAEDWAKDVSR
ncbi:MAG: helix-turn-helix transcriptional regulator [Hyphomonadaceae bacterium]|nr:helix-turn-helix transcriptional regulator [Hyphomonadaceae bacterium]